jgi:predicted DNA-binding transcriptional regulator AlpA
MTSINDTRIVRPAKLAERLGISRVTLWRWERKGLLPPKRRVGPNVVGWLEAEIDEWFAEKTPAQTAAASRPELTAVRAASSARVKAAGSSSRR